MGMSNPEGLELFTKLDHYVGILIVMPRLVQRMLEQPYSNINFGCFSNSKIIISFHARLHRLLNIRCMLLYCAGLVCLCSHVSI